MRTKLILSFFLFLSFPCWAGISGPQQQVIVTGVGSSNFTLTFTIATPKKGNSLILYAGTSLNASTISSVVESNVTWTFVKRSNTQASRDVEIWIGNAIGAGGTTVTVTFSGICSSVGCDGNITEWYGILPASPVDQTGANNGNDTTPTSATITPTTGLTELIFAATRVGGNYVSGPTSGFTALTSSSVRDFGAYLIVPKATGNYSTTWTTASGAWDMAIASFFSDTSVLRNSIWNNAVINQ